MPETSAAVLAIDLGGSKISSALVSREGRVLASERVPTLAAEGPQPVIGRIFGLIDSLLARHTLNPSDFCGISIAAAGAVDSARGLVTFSPNLPGWLDIPLRDIIREKYTVDTFLVNDASAAALGEHRLGAGRGTRDMVLLTLGTGIGGGIIIDGRLYTGATGAAAELGHMVIDIDGPDCPCGNRGCLEVLASGTAVAREAVSRIRSGGKSALADMAGGRLDSITAVMVEAAARQGDALAADVIHRAATYLGYGMTSLVNIFNPEALIIGGGMSDMGDLLLEPARQIVRTKAFPVSAAAVRIGVAEVGNDAGLYGAACFAFEQSE
ncbi:MAG: ROK family protein [Chloroflexi bacterium]|nr:ROK family protein [Chloroflexota bacterium]